MILTQKMNDTNNRSDVFPFILLLFSIKRLWICRKELKGMANINYTN